MRKKTSCNSISNCLTCFEEHNSKIHCTQCSNGYLPTYDGKSCVILAEQDCNTSITGCLKCSNINPGVCYTCNSELGFTITTRNDLNLCICQNGFDLVNDDFCLPPLQVVSPTPTPESVV